MTYVEYSNKSVDNRPVRMDCSHKGLIGSHNGKYTLLYSRVLLQFINPLLLFFYIEKFSKYTSVFHSLSLSFSISILFDNRLSPVLRYRNGAIPKHRNTLLSDTRQLQTFSLRWGYPRFS
jgi:hypothetical protein